MNLSTLQTQVAEWAERNFPDAKPHQPLLGIGEENGELAQAHSDMVRAAARLNHAHLKMEQGIRGDKAEHYEAKVDAIGDLFIFAAHYCELNEINLDAAVTLTWNRVRQRDWKKNKETGV